MAIGNRGERLCRIVQKLEDFRSHYNTPFLQQVFSVTQMGIFLQFECTKNCILTSRVSFLVDVHYKQRQAPRLEMARVPTRVSGIAYIYILDIHMVGGGGNFRSSTMMGDPGGGEKVDRA